MSPDGQRIKWRRNIPENFNRLSRVHERYRQTDRETEERQTTDRQTDGRRHSEREREFTFAKNRAIRSGFIAIFARSGSEKINNV